MSTRASIIYDSELGIHFYQEMLDDNVCLEINRNGINIIVELMPMDKWLKLGLPNLHGLYKVKLKADKE
jgi:hypothetical protein